MKKSLITFFLAFLCLSGFAASVIDPFLRDEMNNRADDEMLKIVVIMNARYDRAELNRRAAYFPTRSQRREYVVNELKDFATATQYDLRKSLAEMESNGLVTEPEILWMANALCFSATKAAINDLAMRNDIALIGCIVQRNWIPDGEEAKEVADTRDITPNVTQVNADDVWELGYTGEGVVVAVIDTGVNYNHLDIADHLWDGGTEFPHHGYDVINNDNDPMDDHGHGSHCSGTVCGDGSSTRQTGMAPDATLMCVKCIDANGSGGANNISNGIQWAVEHGCDLFSMSLGVPSSSVSERTLLRHTCEAALDAGVVAAIAAGNEGDKQYQYPIPNNVRVPGSCPPPYMDDVQGTNPGGLTCSVCVGAVDYNDSPAYFTSIGPVTWSNTEFADYPYQPEMGLIRPDVCAPGVDIISLNYQNNTGYVTMSGTSMATPCVAGCMCLMLSKNIELTPAEVCQILEETVVPLSETKNNVTGFGRVDVLAAIEAIQTGPIAFDSYALDDAQGNGNHHLNPGETVSISLSMTNTSDAAVSGVMVEVVEASEGITILNGTTGFGTFAAGATVVADNALVLQASENMLANDMAKLTCNVIINGTVSNTFKMKVLVYGNALQFGTVAVLGDDNDDGMLEPGETATLRVFVDNEGNELASNVSGVLSSDYQYVTINVAEQVFGTIGAGLMAYADFNVTLDAAAPADFSIPFELVLTDANAKQTDLSFNYKNACNIIFALSDSWGDGWNGASMDVSFSDGSPTQNLTISSGSSATYTLEVANGVRVTITWRSGNYDSECSFTVSYEGGETIYQSGTLQSGVLCVFNANCSGGGGSLPDFCEPIGDLTAEIDGNDVILAWEAPATGVPTGYEVYKNTELLQTVNDLTYTDLDVAEGTYSYCVYAIYDDCQSEFVCVEVALSACAGVENLAYALMPQEGVVKVDLTWETPEDPTDLQHYEVYLNDEMLGTTVDLHYEFELTTAGAYSVSVVAMYPDCSKASSLSLNLCPWPYALAANFVADKYHFTWESAGEGGSYQVYANGALQGETSDNFYDLAVDFGTTTVCVESNGNCEPIQVCADVCLESPVTNLVVSNEDMDVVATWTAPETTPEHYLVLVNEVSYETDETVMVLSDLQVGTNAVTVTPVYSQCPSVAAMVEFSVCASVTNIAYAYQGELVAMTWEGNADTYLVYVNRELLATVDTLAYAAEIEPGEHQLCIVSVSDTCDFGLKACMEMTLCAAPANLKTTDVREGRIDLAWDAVATATGYVLYRNDEIIAENLAGTTYSDTSMTLDYTYTYAVAARSQFGVSDLSQWVEVPYYTGIDEQEQGLSIYPNPTADKVVIECEGMTRVEVYNVEGKRVSAVETQGDSYEVDGLQNGVYMLRIFKGDVVIVRKVVKM